MSSTFTCITCRVAFKDADIQRQHYKSDWHRYNLKRKVAELPAVTAEEFAQRVLKQRALDAESEKDKTTYCPTCRKTFSCVKSYENHLGSKRHKEKLENYVEKPKLVQKQDVEKKEDETMEESDVDIETDSEVEELSSDEWNEDDESNPINRNKCLFCHHSSDDLEDNLKHMTEIHSFFVPDIEYCVDLRGLLLYLGAKIHQGYMCLWCNEKSKSFQSVMAVQKHMVDKGHCQLYHEGEALAEYSDYYDYSTSYPDHEGKNPDEEVEIPVLEDNDYQLVLPSGSVIGHRSLMRYYKQNLDPKKGMLVQHKINNVLSTYKAHGYTPLQKEIAQRKARDIYYMRKAQQKYSTQLGCKANKLQKHFRPQVNF